MDFQTSVDSALTDNGAAIQYAAAATIEPGAVEAIRVLRSQRETLSYLRDELRMYSGDMDGVPPKAA